MRSYISATSAGLHVTKYPTKLRFAVATFDTWESMCGALQALSLEGFPHEAFSYLGLSHVLPGAPVETGLPTVGPTWRELAFPRSAITVCCTGGPVAQCLMDQLQAGAPTLQAALSPWLIPRHAASLQNAVEQGQIALWVQLADSESEFKAYRGLLARSSGSVGVHDLGPAA